MPLGWFSKKEYDVYHVCLNCQYSIDEENLVIMLESKILRQHKNLDICEDCFEKRMESICEETYSCAKIIRAIAT